jgi:hypothetical protein
MPADQEYATERTNFVSETHYVIHFGNPHLQDHRKRPDTSTLLSYRAVRDAATELGLALPAAATVAKPALAGIAPHVMAGVSSSAAPGALAGTATNPIQ